MFFFPQTIETRHSEINGTVKVVKLFNTLSLVAGGYTQSGGLVRIIWRNALQSLKKEGLDPKQCLILGLGAGSAAQELVKLWPKAKMIGVELDPMMIELGKKYFALGKIQHLKIIKGDAISWVLHKKNSWKHRFDLILLDLYLGGEVPAVSRQRSFLKALRILLTDRGIILVNHLIRKGGEKEIEALKKDLQSLFQRVVRIPTSANAVFAAYK